MKHRSAVLRLSLGCLCLGVAMHSAPTLDETPAAPGQWGFRPDPAAPSQVTPPGFSWRPQKDAVEYALEISRTPDFATVEYRADGIVWNVHCPPRTLAPGQWHWRFRCRDKSGEWSAWSQVRPFAVAEGANELPLPARADLVARIPGPHPRLFVRPEWIPEMRQRAQGDLKPLFDRMVEAAEKTLANPPPTAEPERYPDDMKRGSDPWRTLWWGNRVYVQKSLGAAAELAFTRLLGGKEEYGLLAKQILLDSAKWDPKGATGYRYNDEAGMPYNYYFARTYTFVHDLLTEEEREICRRVMAVRGDEMFRHLCPRHLWQPYASHSNRAWHFLGEIGIAFHGEIPEADEWTWFAANVFANAYPVWSDADGGWHEGSAYWNSYIARFTWWADVMRAALDIDAFRKPYFSQVGYYTMYLAPPGTLTGGFGDLAPPRPADSNRGLMTVLAAQAGNPHWQWYVNALGGPEPVGGYVGFVRGALPQVEARPPDDLPTSRLFRGTGLAFLNSDLADGAANVAVHFKSSPFGNQSHGYDAQNSFLLHVYGERVFIRSGRRDSYGSDHHKNWMWETKSVNSITVNGQGQTPHTAAAVGEITSFQTTRDFDYVAGEAATAYPKGLVDRFTRRILFVKPDAVVVWDTLATPEPATFAWHLHACHEMARLSDTSYRAVQGKAACLVEFLEPRGLRITQTDRFDPPPRPRVKLVEYHLTAATPEKRAAAEFVTVLRPHSAAATLAGASAIETTDGGHLVT
ncbi:MAG: DUF4962 domain-containing protein, partial [Lentisphaeria bacterium]|nr:DUF4962 domain-containing protein [Lentisphaeria bacterium]